MDSNKNIIERLQEEIRITRALTLAIREETKQLEESIRAGGRTEVSSPEQISIWRQEADAAWALVEAVREEMKQRKEKKKPFWKRWFS